MNPQVLYESLAVGSLHGSPLWLDISDCGDCGDQLRTLNSLI